MLPLYHISVHDCGVCVVSDCESVKTAAGFPSQVCPLSCGHADGVLPLWTFSQAFYRWSYLQISINWMPFIKKKKKLHRKFEINLTLPPSQTSSVYRTSSHSSYKWGACHSRTLPMQKKNNLWVTKAHHLPLKLLLGLCKTVTWLQPLYSHPGTNQCGLKQVS